MVLHPSKCTSYSNTSSPTRCWCVIRALNHSHTPFLSRAQTTSPTSNPNRSISAPCAAPLGLNSPRDLFFGHPEGFVARYERAIALPPRPLVGRARGSPFFSSSLALAAVAPRKAANSARSVALARRRRERHRRSLERDLLRETFAARARCMHRRGPWPLGPML